MKKQIPTIQPVMLIILDGWGIRNSSFKNSVKNANTPNFDRFWRDFPHAKLKASNGSVGLPPKYIGNSEVGHTHLGAGRLIPQELTKINKTIKDGSFFKNKTLLKAMKHCSNNGSSLHVMGLVSDGGVHSHIDHLFALLKMAKQVGVNSVLIHCFMDGRDKPPTSGIKYIKQVLKETKKLGIGRISTIMGRFYAMDRDNRWNREHKAYDAIVNCKGLVENDPVQAIKNAYKRGETDEFIQPIIIQEPKIKCKFKPHDSIIHFNFRSDRARELTRAFVQGKFNKFKRKTIIDLDFASLVQYDKKIKTDVAFPPEVPNNTLGEVVWKAGLRQYRAAETEKYAHVTYFLNGGREKPFPKEERCVVPSPKVKTYDLMPEMSIYKLTKLVNSALKKKKFHFVALNFANADMVGHSGIYEATRKACEIIDECLGSVVETARNSGYELIITADHGNAEEMTGKYRTSHTMNKVPMILVSGRFTELNKIKTPTVQNVAPTVLAMMGIKKPEVLEQSFV